MSSPQTNRSEFLLTVDTAYRILGFVVEKSHYLVAVFFLAGLAAFGINSMSPPEYEAQALLVLAPAPFKQDKGPVSELLPRTLTIQDYEILAKSDPILKEFRDKSGWKDDDGKPVPLKDMREKVRAQIFVTKQTSLDVQHSPILALTVRAETGEEAAARANAWAQVAVEASRNYGRFGGGGTLDILRKEYTDTQAEYDRRLDTSAQRLDILQTELNKAKETMLTRMAEFNDRRDAELAILAKELQIELLEQEVTSLKEQIALRLELLAEVEVEVQSVEKRLTKLEGEQEKLSPLLTLNKGLTDTAAAILAAESGSLDVISGRTIVSQEINEVYVSVATAVSELRGDLEAARQKQSALEQQLESDRADYKAYFGQLLDAKNTYAARERELEAEGSTLESQLAKDVLVKERLDEWEAEKIKVELKDIGTYYSALSEKTMSARLAEAELEPDMRVLANAQPSVYNLPRGRAIKSLATAIFAFIVALVILLLISGFREHTGTRKNAEKGIA